MNGQVVAHWLCEVCDVEGEDPGPDPRCWNCGGAVTVTARPAIPPSGRRSRHDAV